MSKSDERVRESEQESKRDFESKSWSLEKKNMFGDFTINWWSSLFPSYFSLFPLVLTL